MSGPCGKLSIVPWLSPYVGAWLMGSLMVGSLMVDSQMVDSLMVDSLMVAVVAVVVVVVAAAAALVLVLGWCWWWSPRWQVFGNVDFGSGPFILGVFVVVFTPTQDFAQGTEPFASACMLLRT